MITSALMTGSHAVRALGLMLFLAWLPACIGTRLNTSSVSVAPTAGAVRFADNQGIKIAYTAIGDGEPLVLIPGLATSSESWRDAGFVEAFLSRGRQLILIDPRGHGLSDKPHDPDAYDAQDLTSDIVSVLDDLAIERADLLGYSRGGWIAMATAARFPHRVRSVTAGGSHPYGADLSAMRAILDQGLEGLIATAERGSGPVSAEARAMIMSNDLSALRAAVTRDQRSIAAELAASEVPVLLYVGSADPWSAAARRFATEADAEYLELPGLNHFQAIFAIEPVVHAVEKFHSAVVD